MAIQPFVVQLTDEQLATIAAGGGEGGGAVISDVTLQSAAVANGNGTPYTPVGNADLAFEITGTSTSRTIVFEMAGPANVYAACMAYGVNDLGVAATQTTLGSTIAPQSWQVSIPVGWKFRARITAVGGGNITISGKAVIR